MEFIHRTRRPFHLIAAQIETFAAGVTIGIEIVKPHQSYTHTTVTSSAASGIAATCLSTKYDVDEAVQKR